MSKAKQAAEQIQNLAVKFEGFLEAAKSLHHIGDLEIAERQALDRKEKAEKASLLAEEELKKYQDLLSQVQENIFEADVKASQIVDSAKRKEEEVLKAYHAKGEAFVKEAVERKASVDSLAILSKNELQKMKQEIKAKQDEFDAIKKQLDQMKASIAAFV